MNRSVSLSFAIAFVTAIALASAPTAWAQGTSERELQALVNDAAFQFKLTHRDNATKLADHHEQLRAAVAGWNASARNEADDRRLAEWLRGAIRASMPGSSGELPPVPKFDSKAKPVPPATPVLPDELPPPPSQRENAVAQASAETGNEAPSPPNGPSLNRTPSVAPTNTPESATPAEQTLMRPTSGPSMAADEFDLFNSEMDTSERDSPTEPAAAEAETTEESTAESVEDFWSEHPASGELPDDLSSGDPFLDDPLPAE